MLYHLRHTLEPGDAPAFATLLAELGWGASDNIGHAETLLHGATWFALAEKEGHLVGYVRALSDRTTVTYLAEIGVAKAHRRRGLGSALLDAVVAEFGYTAIYASASPEAVSLLAKHGIRARPEYFIACARKPSL